MPKNEKKLVVVESPTKARTIRKFLSSDYLVESCMGHVRDLPRSKSELPEKYKKEVWADLGVDIKNNFNPIYCVPQSKAKKLKSIRLKLKEVKELILATDEDREGESISWHLLEVLKPKTKVKRIVFHEITKAAIDKALKEFRHINQNLVRAQETRRILDRLVGYTLSPLIWKKIAYGLSAGRVQSVALRLMIERELERIHFLKANYSSLSAFFSKKEVHRDDLNQFKNPDECLRQDGVFEAKLYSYGNQRIVLGSDFDGKTGQLFKSEDFKEGKSLFHLTENKAREFLSQMKGEIFFVTEVKEKPFFRRPEPPFITSTLQQEANRKLNFTSKRTMDVAQKLYEKGLITYMRTDANVLSQEALKASRKFIKAVFGSAFLPEAPRTYTGKKSKGAQEAHEAIRPAGLKFLPPDQVPIEGDDLKLYELIWRRTLASQMTDARYMQMQAKISSGSFVFSVSGQTLEMEGFLKVYLMNAVKLDEEKQNKKEEERKLPKLKKGEKVFPVHFELKNHETKPPPRFSEAYLIQMMEKNGIGRPSTYASIINTIEQRGYVQRKGRALAPTFVSFAVSNLLSQYLPDYVDIEFTSKMEEALDDIARGDLVGQKYLKRIYLGENGLKHQVEQQEREINAEESRRIFLKKMPLLTFRIGRYGAYVCRKEGLPLGSSGSKNGKSQLKQKDQEVCASIPQSLLPGDITEEIANQLIDRKIKGTDALGVDPKTGQKVYILTGRFGSYVQLGETESLSKNEKKVRNSGAKKRSLKNRKPLREEKTFKTKRISIPNGMDPEDLTIEEALELLSFPKLLGEHPKTKKEVKVGFGRFGPYVVCDNDFRSIPKSKHIFDIQLRDALELLNEPKKKRGRGKREVLKEWKVKGEKGEKKITLLNGPYGPYIKCGEVNISIPDKVQPDLVDLQQALSWLKEKKGKKERPKRRKNL